MKIISKNIYFENQIIVLLHREYHSDPVYSYLQDTSNKGGNTSSPTAAKKTGRMKPYHPVGSRAYQLRKAPIQSKLLL